MSSWLITTYGNSAAAHLDCVLSHLIRIAPYRWTLPPRAFCAPHRWVPPSIDLSRYHSKEGIPRCASHYDTVLPSYRYRFRRRLGHVGYPWVPKSMYCVPMGINCCLKKRWMNRERAFEETSGEFDESWQYSMTCIERHYCDFWRFLMPGTKKEKKNVGIVPLKILLKKFWIPIIEELYIYVCCCWWKNVCEENWIYFMPFLLFFSDYTWNVSSSFSLGKHES